MQILVFFLSLASVWGDLKVKHTPSPWVIALFTGGSVPAPPFLPSLPENPAWPCSTPLFSGFGPPVSGLLTWEPLLGTLFPDCDCKNRNFCCVPMDTKQASPGLGIYCSGY